MESNGKKSGAENERQGWGHSLPQLRYHRTEDSMLRRSKRASKTRLLSSSEMNLPASGFLRRFGSLTWRKKKSNVLYGSGLVSPGSTLVDSYWSLGQLNRPVDSESNLKDERPKSCYVETLFADSALENADCPKDNQNIQRNLEMSTSFDCLADGTISYCSSEVDAGDRDAQLQTFRTSVEKEETNEQVCLPFLAQSILHEYIPELHKPEPSPVLKKQGDTEEKCLHSKLTYNTLLVRMTEEQSKSVPHSPSHSDKPLEPNQYSQIHPKCPSFQNDEQDTPQLNPPYPAVQEEVLAQKAEASTVSSTESPKLHVNNQFQTQATLGAHKVRYEIIITMEKKGQMDETDVPELGGAMSIGEELVGPDLNLSPPLECQACGHHRAGAAALTAQALTEQPKKYTNLADEKNSEKNSEQKRGGETCMRAHLDRDISLERDEEHVYEETLEYYRSQSSKMERKFSLNNEYNHSPEKAQPSRMVLSNNEVSREPTNTDRESYSEHFMDMRKVLESNGSKEDYNHKLKSVKSNSYNSVTENKSAITQNEHSEFHKPIYSQVFKPPKPHLDRKVCNELLSHLARKKSVNAAQAWECRKKMDNRTVLEKEMIHLRDRDVKVKETEHKNIVLPLKDLIVHPRTPTPPPDKSRATSVLLTSPKGWRKECFRPQSPRPLHVKTDANMDSAKSVRDLNLSESSHNFTITTKKDGYQNYVTDSFSEKTAEEESGINNVLITNLQKTNKSQSENSFKMTILQNENCLDNIGRNSITDDMTTDWSLTQESNRSTTIYKLSEKQMRDTGGSEEVIIKSVEKESPVQDAANGNTLRGVSNDCYEQINIYDTVKSIITGNRKVVDIPVASDHMHDMHVLTPDQPVILDYTFPFLVTNLYNGAKQDESQNCHIAESTTGLVTSRNYINPLEEKAIGTAVSGYTFENSETRSFIWDFPAYSGHWPTSTVLENIHTDNMNDNVYNGWHKAKAQMVYTSTEDESDQNAQDKPILEFWTKPENKMISHPDVKGYKTANKTDQDCELAFVISTEDGQSGENQKQTRHGTAANENGLGLGFTNQQQTDNDGTMQEHIKKRYDSGIKEGTVQVAVEQSAGLSDDKAGNLNTSHNVDDILSVVTNDKPVGNDLEKVACLTQDALVFVPLKGISQKQVTFQEKEFIHMHGDGVIDISPANEFMAKSYSHMNNDDKSHHAGELFHILTKEIPGEHAYDLGKRDLEKLDMTNNTIDINDLAPSMEDQANNMIDLLAVNQTGDILVYTDTKDALVEQDNDQTDFLQKPEELLGQTDDANDIRTCVNQDALVHATFKDEFLTQITSQPSKEFIHLYTNSEIDIKSAKEAQADLNINMNNEDKTHQAGELFQIFSKEISDACDQGKIYLDKTDVANDSIDMIYITPSVKDQAENMSGLLALDEVGDMLVYLSTKEESVEQDNQKEITDELQELEQLVDQTDNATHKNISNWESDHKKDQPFDYICRLDVSEEHNFIQSKEYLIYKPMDEIDPTVNVIHEHLDENPEEHDSGLADDETVDMHTYRLRKGKSIQNTNEKPSSDIIQKPVDQENHVASPTVSYPKGIQAEHIINLTVEDIKSQSNHSQNGISFASFSEASVEHNKYEPVGIDQGEDVIHQSTGRISIVPTDEQHSTIPGKQVDFITMKPKMENHSENSLLAVKNDMQEMSDKIRSNYVTNGINLLTQEAQKIENTNLGSFISYSHFGQIFSEINSKVCEESVQDADTQTSGPTNIENKMSPDVLECSMSKVLTNLPEQSVQLVQGSHVYCTVPGRNEITIEYAGDWYNLQTEEESSKDMETWINTLRLLEIPEIMKYQRVPRQPRHSALSMYATLPPIKEDVCSPNSDQIDSISLPQEKNYDLGINQDPKTIQNEKKYCWEKNLEKPLQSSPLEMMRKHSGEEDERMTSHKSLLTQNLSQRQGSIIGSLLSERQERKNEHTEGKSFSRLKSSLLLNSYIKPKKESLSVYGEEAESLLDLVHTEAGSTRFLPNVDVPRTPESPKHPVTGTHTPPKSVDSVPPLVSRELPCKSNLRTVSQFKASTDIWHHTKKEHGKVNPRPGKVLLFSDPGFSGKCYEIYGNVSDTSEWEFKETISIRVIRGGWILYEEPRFHGRRVMLLEGDAELKCPWLEQTDLKGEPQSTSPFWVGSLRHVVRDFQVPKISLFLKPNGEGEKVHIEGAAPDMSEYGGTIKTESIIVHCGMWLVFSKPLFQGDPYILEPGGYPNRRSWGAEDPQVCSLEAARIGGPIVEKPNEPKLLLFQMPESEGTCLEVTRDMNSIQGELNLQGEKLYSMGSLKVIGGCWVGYEKEGFRGHQYLLEEGVYNNFSDWGGCTEELGSVRLIRTDFAQPEIVLYELPGCLEGPCLRLSESLADLEEAQYGRSTGSIHVLSGVWVAYENVDFSGEQYILEKGIYHNHQDWGAENCKISSVQPVIQVGGNSLHFVAKIHLFTKPNFYGDCLICREDHIELPESFSPQSCRVECGSWSLFEGESCSGEQYILSEGEYPTRTAMGCLTPCPLRSLKMVPLYFSIPSISLHGLERFEGKELDFTEEVRSLQGEGYNNHVMSVSVKSGIWVVYEHSDFRGRQWLLERKQIPNWLLYSGLQRIGSLCPIRQRTVYFRLRNRNLGLFLCVAELTEDMKAARVLVTEPQDGRCLLWFYEEGRLKNQMAPHMSLQVIGQSCSGTKVVLWSESRKPIQNWILEDSGCITSSLFKGMCLDVKGGQCYDSDHVVIWATTEDRPTQQWDLEVF